MASGKRRRTDQVGPLEAENALQDMLPKSQWISKWQESSKPVKGGLVQWSTILFIDGKPVAQGRAGRKKEAREVTCQTVLDALDYI